MPNLIGTPLHRAYQEADDAWSAELRRSFPRNSGDMRYRTEGKGEPGTALRVAFDARDAARVAYETAAGHFPSFRWDHERKNYV